MSCSGREMPHVRPDLPHVRPDLDAFGRWLFEEAPWATIDIKKSREIDKRIADAVSTNDVPARVALTIAELKSHLEVITWASDLWS